MDDRILKGGLVLAAMLGLGGCADDCRDGETPQGTCPGSGHVREAVVRASIGAPGAYDSVVVKLYRGSVESGTVLDVQRFATGAREVSWSRPLGEHAVEASYWRGRTVVSALDGGSTSEKQVSHCTCYSYEAQDLSLDLTLAAWP